MKNLLNVHPKFAIQQKPKPPVTVLHEGKHSLTLDLKQVAAKSMLRKLCKYSDILIDPYRPGVLERLGLGPDTLLTDNPRLIYARLTGFGQTGPLSQRAGHDINYAGLSGILSMLGRIGEKPTAPINLLADFAGGGLMCAFGICIALLERERSGRGQIVDSSMTEGAAYVGSWLMRSQRMPIWGRQRGENLLDTGAFFYDTYETQDGKYMSVGALEPQFYQQFVDALGLNDMEQYGGDNAVNRERVADVFRTRSQQEWSDIFETMDACVFPVLDWNVADEHPQNRLRQSFVDRRLTDGAVVPAPAPVLSRTPGESAAVLGQLSAVENRRAVLEMLLEIGYSEADVRQLQNDGVLELSVGAKL